MSDNDMEVPEYMVPLRPMSYEILMFNSQHVIDRLEYVSHLSSKLHTNLSSISQIKRIICLIDSDKRRRNFYMCMLQNLVEHIYKDLEKQALYFWNLKQFI